MQFGPKHLRADANPFHATPLALCGARPKKGFPSHSHEYFQKMGKQHRASGARRRAIKRAWGARCFVDREEEEEDGMKRYL